jgi:cytochrome c nitrite reductase small subunit
MIKNILRYIPNQFILPLFIVGGLVGGLGVYAVYMSRTHSYLSDDPAACVNCHIMAPYYQSWNHSSHAKWATCNDCHVPHDNVLTKYAFKAKDGLYHAAIFTMRGEPDVIRPRQESYEVIMNNCIRCHTALNTDFVKTGMIDYTQAEAGQGKACWDCHTQVPHTKVSNLSSSPHAIVPLPASPVPDWLKQKMKKTTE